MPTFEELQSLLSKTRQEYGQRVAQLPGYEEKLRQQVYGQEKILPSLRTTRDAAIMQLYDADKRLAGSYANPQSEMFIQDPYKREQLISQQAGDIFQTVSGTTRLAEQRQDVLGDIIDKGLRIFQAGLEAKRNEFNMISEELSRAIQTEGAKTRKAKAAKPTASLGDILSLLGRQKPGEGPQYSPLKPEQMVEQGGKKWRFNRQTGGWEDISKAEELGLTPQLLDYLSSVSGTDQDIAEKYLSKLLFPSQTTPSQAELKRRAYVEAYNAKLSGASTDDIKGYIQSQGFSPSDPDFLDLFY